MLNYKFIIYRWRHPSPLCHAWGFLQGLGSLLDGLVMVGTLGFYASGFNLYFSRLRAYHYIQQQKAKRND